MKWRHSKEAQAQKDKEKELPDKSATETEPKERDDSEGESEPSESEFEDGAEDKSDVDISDLNKASVIIPGAVAVSTQDTSSTNSTTEPSPAAHAQVQHTPLWGRTPFMTLETGTHQIQSTRWRFGIECSWIKTFINFTVLYFVCKYLHWKCK